MRRLMMNVIAAVGAWASAAAGQTYHVQDLGTLGGLGDTQAFGISRQPGAGARLAGFATRADHAQHGFVFGGAMQEILPLAPDTQSVAYGIDGQGRVVGVMYQLGSMATHAFRVDGGSLALLGGFTARAVNVAGVIAGFMPVTETVGLSGDLKFDHAVMYNGASLVDLGTQGGSHWSRGYAINGSGMVVGCGGRPDDTGSRALAWVNGVATDLGGNGGIDACAYAINDGFVVVGYSTRGSAPEVRAAARWVLGPNGQVLQRADLGTLPATAGTPAWSDAYGINSPGKIVGASNGRGFVYEYGAMRDLNGLIPSMDGWFIVAARAIDETDAIAAWGVTRTNEPRALLLVRCDADFDRSGAVSLQDLFDFLAAYFENDIRADMDHSGAVGVQDIFTFLSLWFTNGC